MIEFNAENHEYKVDGNTVISVTQLLKKQGLAPDYSGVNEEILKAYSERGTLIHEEIENYINHGTIGFTSELADFIELCKEHDIKPTRAEVIVGNEIVAGTVDIIGYIGKQTIVIDTKTTSVLHKEAVRWQLSLYNYLMKGWGQRIGVMHLGEKSRFVELDPIPTEEIERLLECERQNTTYSVDLQVDHNELEQMFEFETKIKALTEEIDKVKQLQDQVKKRLYDQMTACECDHYEGDKIIITRYSSGTVDSIDAKRLRKELPEVAKKYTKTSNRAGYVRITIK